MEAMRRLRSALVNIKSHLSSVSRFKKIVAASAALSTVVVAGLFVVIGNSPSLSARDAIQNGYAVDLESHFEQGYHVVVRHNTVFNPEIRQNVGSDSIRRNIVRSWAANKLDVVMESCARVPEWYAVEPFRHLGTVKLIGDQEEIAMAFHEDRHSQTARMLLTETSVETTEESSYHCDSKAFKRMLLEGGSILRNHNLL